MPASYRRVLYLASDRLVDTLFFAALTPPAPALRPRARLGRLGAGLLAAAYPLGPRRCDPEWHGRRAVRRHSVLVGPASRSRPPLRCRRPGVAAGPRQIPAGALELLLVDGSTRLVGRKRPCRRQGAADRPGVRGRRRRGPVRPGPRRPRDHCRHGPHLRRGCRGIPGASRPRLPHPRTPPGRAAADRDARRGRPRPPHPAPGLVRSPAGVAVRRSGRSDR